MMKHSDDDVNNVDVNNNKKLKETREDDDDDGDDGDSSNNNKGNSVSNFEFISCKAMLQNGKLSDVQELKDGEIVFVKATDRIMTVHGVLRDNKILSVPVLDDSKDNKVSNDDKKGNLLGVVDVLDITAMIVQDFKGVHADKLKDGDADEDTELLQSFFHERTLNYGVHGLENFSLRDKCETVVDDGKKTLYDIALLLSKPNTHRVLILEEKSNKVVNIITQSGLLHFIYRVKANKFPSQQLFARSVAAMTHKTKDVVSVKSTDPALTAFRLMHRHKVSGLAVVDDKGYLIDNISSSDLKLYNEWLVSGSSLKFCNFAEIGKPVNIYLTDLRREESNKQPPQKRVLSCTSKSTLDDVLAIITGHHIHRIYIVGTTARQAGIATGVISLSDIIAEILS